MPNSELAIGIDLGTTQSAIATLDDHHRPVTLVNSDGHITTPSVVLFDQDRIIVGEEALMALGDEAENVAMCAKRDMGRRAYHRQVRDRELPPEVIQACVLKKLVNDASRQCGPIQQAVITVPAYFDESRRKATQDAGYIAGLEVQDIINEPTAAALAFGRHDGMLDGQGHAKFRQRLLVYDLGGGTFDVSIVEIDGSTFTTLATDGDFRLGGYDWDTRLVDHVAGEFLRQHGIDPRNYLAVNNRLWRNCEAAKRALSSRPASSVTCELRELASRLKITRETFEELTADLLDRTATTTGLTLKSAGLAWSDIDQVLLAGGSTRMPAVRRMLHGLSGQEPHVSVSPDEVVAHGAALRSGVLMQDPARPQFAIINVNSHSLGIIGQHPTTGKDRNDIVIQRNTPLPCGGHRVFRVRRSNQRSIRIPLVEGETVIPDGCLPVGEFVIRQLPPSIQEGDPVEIAMHYEPNGRIALSVRVANSDQPVEHELVRANSLARDELDLWRAFVSQRMVG